MNSSTTTMRSHVAQREENSSFSAWRRPTSPPGCGAGGLTGGAAGGGAGGGQRNPGAAPGRERASISATTRFIGGGGAKRSSEGRLGPRSGRMSDASRSAIARQSSDGAGGGTGRREARAGAAGAGGGSALLELLGLLDEGLLIGDLDGQDALDVLDLLVLLVELQVLLEVHLLPHQRALRVGPQVAHLGGRREGDLAVGAGGRG